MSKNKYSVGDVVKLNAGGPDMSVSKVIEGFGSKEFEHSYKCQWFAGKKLESGVFEEASLIKSNPEVDSNDS